MIQRDDVVKEAMDFVNDKGRQATDDEIDDGISFPTWVSSRLFTSSTNSPISSKISV
jgi:hypothetical protein